MNTEQRGGRCCFLIHIFQGNPVAISGMGAVTVKIAPKPHFSIKMSILPHLALAQLELPPYPSTSHPAPGLGIFAEYSQARTGELRLSLFWARIILPHPQSGLDTLSPYFDVYLDTCHLSRKCFLPLSTPMVGPVSFSFSLSVIIPCFLLLYFLIRHFKQ